MYLLAKHCAQGNAVVIQPVKIHRDTPEPTTHQDKRTSHVLSICYVAGISHLLINSHITLLWWGPLFQFHHWANWDTKHVVLIAQCVWAEVELRSELSNTTLYSWCQRMVVVKGSKKAKFFFNQNIPPRVWWWVSYLFCKIHGFLSLGISEHICSQGIHLLDCCGKSQGWLK